MNTQHSLLRPFSFLRLFLIGLLLSTTLAISVTSQATVVKADSGEAPYGTPTQALESALSLGDNHTCVIVNTNVVCYGTNSMGQLGNGTQISSQTPVYVRNSGAANDYLSGVISVAAAADHTCALLSNGKVKCWGYGYRTGTGFFVSNVLYATFVKSSFLEGDTNPQLGEHLTGAVAITSATYGGCALLSDGKVKCWGGGAGHDGEGTGYVLACKTPATTGNCSVTGGEVPLTGVKSITQAGQTSCGILTDDSLVCWGQDQGKFANSGNIATDSQLPKPAGSSTVGAKAFGTTQGAICGLYKNGTTSISSAGGIVKCWGSNAGGQLGRGFTDVNTYYSALAVSGLTNAIAISGHGGSFCALLITSEVKCWGSNPNNQFGAAVGTDKNTPTSMTFGGSPITGVAAVTLGQAHICIIMAVDGLVRCLGSNISGQLGDGTLITRGVPTDVVRGEVTGTGGKLTGAGADIMPPALQSKEVNTSGSKIVLTYDEEMATTGLPLTSRFIVTVGGAAKNTASISVDGRKVELNMVDRITPGATVLLQYTEPSLQDDSDAIQDASFNDGASIPSESILNNSNTEGVAPTLVSAAVNAAGTSLTLTYNEALGSTTAANIDFAVTVGGASRAVTARTVSGSTVVLTLASAVLAGTTVTVSYTAPTSDLATTNNAIQDSAGNDAASFNSSAVAVTNGSTFDNVAPVFQSAAVSGDKAKIILTYNEALGATTAPTTAFVVQVNGSTRSVTGVATSGSTVELTLASSVGTGQTVTVQYTAPTVNTATSNSAIQDTAGNDALLIASSTSVANVEDTTSPVLQSGSVNALGTSLTLTYSESLSSTTAPTNAFTVTVGGTTRAVSAAVVIGSTVVLTLASAIGQGQAVTVAYTDPTTGNDANAVQDSAGNDAASEGSSAIGVTNGSSVDQAAPTFVSARVDPMGALAVTYSEALAAPAPATSAIAVTIGGVAATVISVTIVGSTIVVVTSPVIGAGQTVTFAYTDPTSGNDANAIQDAQGNDVASSVSSYTVPGANNASAVDRTSPTFVSGAVDTSGSLVVTYSEALAAPAPATTAIAVTIGGVAATVVSVTIVGSTVVVVTSPVIQTGDVVTFRYTDPSSGNDSNALQDAAGNDVGSSSSAYSIPSASNRSTVDVSPPTGVTIGIEAGGSQIIIRFDEDLSPTGPAAADFTVTVDGVKYTVTKAEIIDGDLVLTVSPLIKSGADVVVSYRDPTTGNDGNALQDAAGNDIPSFGDVKGKNSSTQVSATNQVDAVLDTTLPISNSPLTPVIGSVDGDAPGASLSTTETQSIAGKAGKASFSDGSTFDVSKNGNLIPKLFTAYIGTVTGSVKVTYKSGKKTVSTTCSYGSYGSTKPKKVTKSVNGFFPKAFISPKKSCLMPKAAITSLNTQLVTISAKLKFVRLWPTTAKAKNPESGAALRPVNRAYSVKIGTPPAS